MKFDPQLLEQLEDPAELHRRLALFHMAHEDVAGTDEVGQILLAHALCLALRLDGAAEVVRIRDPNAHGRDPIEIVVSIMAVNPRKSKRSKPEFLF